MFDAIRRFFAALFGHQRPRYKVSLRNQKVVKRNRDLGGSRSLLKNLL